MTALHTYPLSLDMCLSLPLFSVSFPTFLFFAAEANAAEQFKSKNEKANSPQHSRRSSTAIEISQRLHRHTTVTREVCSSPPESKQKSYLSNLRIHSFCDSSHVSTNSYCFSYIFVTHFGLDVVDLLDVFC